MAAIPVPPPRHRLPHKGRKLGAARGFPGSAVAPSAPGMSWLPARGTQPASESLCDAAYKGLLPQSGIPCLSSSFPSAMALESYEGPYP